MCIFARSKSISIRIGLAVKKREWKEVERLLTNEKKQVDGMDFSLRQIRNQYLRQYYEMKGEYRLAYQNLKADNLMNDSLEHNRTNMRSVDIMQRFAQDTLQLHHRIASFCLQCPEQSDSQLRQERCTSIDGFGEVDSC